MGWLGIKWLSLYLLFSSKVLHVQVLKLYVNHLALIKCSVILLTSKQNDTCSFTLNPYLRSRQQWLQ